MCEQCGMAYSFYFGVQYHKSTCPVIVADREANELRKADRISEQESFMAMESKMLGEE